MGQNTSIARRLAGALALLAVLLHGGIVSLHAAPPSDPLARLMALGAFCFAAGTTASDPAGIPIGDEQGKLPPKCPLCTALGGVHLAPPPAVPIAAPPALVRIDPSTTCFVAPSSLRTAQARARAPPPFLG